MYHIGDEAHIGVKLVIYRHVNIDRNATKFRETNSFLYCMQGGFDFDFGTYTVKVRPGELMYIPYGSSYAYTIAEKPTEYYQIQFSVYDKGEPVSLGDKAIVTPAYKSDKYLALISEAYENYVRNKDNKSLCMGSLLKMIGYFETEDTQAGRFKSLSAIAPALTHIERHYYKNTSVEELADMCSLSVSGIEKIFKRAFGMTPARYRNNIRIEHSKELLSGGYSIEEIANITGFSDRYYFSKMFKKQVGVSPGEYQENNRNK